MARRHGIEGGFQVLLQPGDPIGRRQNDLHVEHGVVVLSTQPRDEVDSVGGCPGEEECDEVGGDLDQSPAHRRNETHRAPGWRGGKWADANGLVHGPFGHGT